VPRAKRKYVTKLIRFPEDIGREVEAIAATEDRTFTAQVIRIIRQWLDERKPANGSAARDAKER
jgi:hypothetical protein